jgi:hypothetical protein
LTPSAPPPRSPPPRRTPHEPPSHHSRRRRRRTGGRRHRHAVGRRRIHPPHHHDRSVDINDIEHDLDNCCAYDDPGRDDYDIDDDDEYHNAPNHLIDFKHDHVTGDIDIHDFDHPELFDLHDTAGNDYVLVRRADYDNLVDTIDTIHHDGAAHYRNLNNVIDAARNLIDHHDDDTSR